jgi:plastocyanin
MFDGPEFRRCVMRSSALLLAVLAVSAVGCDDSFTSSGNNVNVAGVSFDPSTITLSGTDRLVVWGFLSGGPHNVTFEDGAMGSGDRTTGAFTRDFAMAAAGTYRYRCTIHSTGFGNVGEMVGSVVVP